MCVSVQKGEYLLHAIATTSIVPVDLNAFLYRMERNMARMHEFLHLRQTVRPRLLSDRGHARKQDIGG